MDSGMPNESLRSGFDMDCQRLRDDALKHSRDEWRKRAEAAEKALAEIRTELQREVSVCMDAVDAGRRMEKDRDEAFKERDGYMRRTLIAVSELAQAKAENEGLRRALDAAMARLPMTGHSEEFLRMVEDALSGQPRKDVGSPFIGGHVESSEIPNLNTDKEAR